MRSWKSLVPAVLVLLLLIACQPQTIEVDREVEVTVITEVEIEVERTVIVKETVEVPVTRVVTATPTNTPEPTPTPEVPVIAAVEGAIAANYLGMQDQGGVELEMVRVLCKDIEKFRSDHLASGVSESDMEEFSSSVTACEFILRITNNTEGAVTLYPNQGQVLINGEQIEPWGFFGTVGDPFEDTSGEIHAGVTRIGGFWFGVRRSAFDEVGTIKYIVSAPVDDDWDSLGEDFTFEISTDGWEFETIPDDLL